MTRATETPSAVQKQEERTVKAIACVVVGCVVVLIIGVLAFGSNDQHEQKAVALVAPVEHNDESPPLSLPKLGPEELLKKEAANLNSGRSGDEEWTHVTYDTWDEKGRSNDHQGAIRGVRCGFAGGTEGLRSEYTVRLGFENGAWTVKGITGVGIKTALLLENLTILNTPRIVAPKGSVVELSDFEAQVNQMKSLDKVQKSWGQNFFAMSDADRSIISAHLEKPATQTSDNNKSPVSQYAIIWDDLNDIHLDSSLTELQQKDRWTEFEGRLVRWTGMVCSVSEDSSEQISMDIQMSFCEWLKNDSQDGSPANDGAALLDKAEKGKLARLCKSGNIEFPGETGSSPNVEVLLRASEKVKAIRLRKGDKIEFTGKVGSLPSHAADKIYIYDGEIAQ